VIGMDFLPYQFCRPRKFATEPRREIRWRRDYLRRVLLWSFGPVLLAIGTIIMGLALIGSSDRGIFTNGLPFLALVAAWIISWFVLRLRDSATSTARSMN